jgi:hypothetical protein
MENFREFPCGCRFRIKENGKFDFKIKSAPMNCPAVWSLLSKGLTKGVFQLESNLGKHWCKELKPESIEHLTALGALLRPGCISGDTTILILSSNQNDTRLSLRALYHKFKRNHYLYNKEIASLNESNLELFNNKIENVIYTGQKEVYKPIIQPRKRVYAELKKRYNVECTLDHKFLTHNRGWIALEDLLIGERVAILKIKRGKRDLLKHAPGEKNFRDICFKHYIYNCIFCDWKDATLDVNHIDGNRKTNNNPDNLCFLCPNHHRLFSEGRIPKEELIKEREKYKIRLSNSIIWGEFTGIEYLGVKDTYDIKVRGPNHNFVAGNMIAHNCLESYDENGINITKRYCLRKNGLEKVDVFHPSIEPILNKTYGVYCYQEQVMEITKEVAGFSLQEADEFRKAAGKKLASLMAEVKVKFVKGCERVGKLTAEQAETLFSQIEKSQRYLFNASHSCCYALDGYMSAYYKTHFPLHFFKSYLKFSHEKQKPLQEVRELVNEAKLMDIQVLGPSILHLKKNFWQDGEKIYFGLADVKKVGYNEVWKLQNLAKDCKEITGRNLQDFTFYHFLLFLSDYIRSEALENWIKVGAFSYINKSRNTMLAEYNAWNSLTDGEKKFMRNNCNLFTELIPALHKTSPKKCDGGGAHNVNRSSLIQSAAKLLENPPTSLDDSPNWIATQEEKLLGIALTCSRIDACDTSDVNTTCKEFNLGQSRQDCIFAVEVKNVKELVTKRGKNPGQAMAQLTVEDHSGSLQMTAFPNIWEEYSGLLTEENTVVIMGYKDKKTGGAIINKVFQI